MLEVMLMSGARPIRSRWTIDDEALVSEHGNEMNGCECCERRLR